LIFIKDCPLNETATKKTSPQSMKKPVAVPDGQLKSNTFSEEREVIFKKFKKIKNPEKAIFVHFRGFHLRP